jgi:hypothetical protein
MIMADAESFVRHLFEQKGFRPDPYDSADISYEPKSGTHLKVSENLRENSAYHDFWTPVYNQGPILQSCVANAAAALHAYEFRKALFSAGVSEPPAINPSRTFIWYNAREAEILAKENNAMKEDEVAKESNIVKEKAKNKTCYPRSAMKSLQQKGVCDESQWPYPTQSKKQDAQDAMDAANERPTSTVISDAAPYRIWRYERVDIKRSKEYKTELKELEKTNEAEATKRKDDDGKLVKDKLRAAISEGHPVQFGIHYYQQNPDDQFVKKGKKWSLTELHFKHKAPTNPHWGNHAVLAIGYDEDSVICQNSYGPDWPDGGFFLAPWSWITDYEATEDFWMVRGFQELADSQK